MARRKPTPMQSCNWICTTSRIAVHSSISSYCWVPSKRFYSARGHDDGLSHNRGRRGATAMTHLVLDNVGVISSMIGAVAFLCLALFLLSGLRGWSRGVTLML